MQNIIEHEKKASTIIFYHQKRERTCIHHGVVRRSGGTRGGGGGVECLSSDTPKFSRICSWDTPKRHQQRRQKQSWTKTEQGSKFNEKFLYSREWDLKLFRKIERACEEGNWLTELFLNRKIDDISSFTWHNQVRKTGLKGLWNNTIIQYKSSQLCKEIFKFLRKFLHK